MGERRGEKLMIFRSKLREHRGQDLEPEVFLIAQTVGTALHDPYLVVQALDEAERDFVLGLAVSSQPIPVPLDHRSELLVRLQSLPLQARPPVIEELSRPGFAVVVPELAEGLLEQVRGVQALVGRQQQLQVLAGRAGEVLRVRQERIFLSLDEATLLAGEACVLGIADLVERFAEVLHHVKLVKQDRRLRGVLVCGVAKRLPHVHDGEANAFGLLFAEKSVELVHARLTPIPPAEPDRPASLQGADHDPVAVALADRDLIDPNDLRAWGSHAPDLLAHVVHLQPLDGLPVQAQLRGNVADRASATAPAHVQGKALRVQCVLDQKVQPLALHRATLPAVDPTHLQVEVNAVIGARQIPNSPAPSVVPTAIRRTAGTADRFFPRRTRVPSRAPGSPNSPWVRCRGRKPGKVYASANRRRLRSLAIRTSCQLSALSQCGSYPTKIGFAS